MDKMRNAEVKGFLFPLCSGDSLEFGAYLLYGRNPAPS